MSISESDVGVKFKLNTGKDISAADSYDIHYKKPSGTTGTWTGTVEDSNYVVYTTVSGDLDESGVWEVQAYVNDGTDYTLRGYPAKFKVVEKIYTIP